MRGRKMNLEDFMARVNKTGNCWIFLGGKDKDGYGQIMVNRKNIRAHRYSYSQFVGEISEDKIVLHRCDNTSCVNPEHLTLGTHKENAQDRVNKGRNRNQNGINNNMSKLTDKEIIEILKDKGSQKTIAKKYGISQQYVSDIKNGKRRIDIFNSFTYNSHSLQTKEK